MFYKKRLTVVLLTGSLLSIVGCGGSDSPVVNSTNELPQLNELSVAITPLSANTETSFAQHVKNGIYLRNSQSTEVTTDPVTTDGTITDSVDSTVAGSNESASIKSDFSATITQEQGVDEADRIKYDGKYLFIANNNYYSYQTASVIPEEGTEKSPEEVSTASPSKSTVRIMERTTDGEISQLSEIDIDADTSHINGLYFNNDTLTVISSVEQFYDIATSQLVGEAIAYTKPTFNITFVDVSEPENTKLTNTFNFDGDIVNSRRVGDVLYIVSRYQPYIEKLPYAITDEEKIANYALINNTDIRNLLPKYHEKNGVEHNLVNEQQCLLPENATDKDGYDTIMTLTAINIQDPQQLNSVCINTSTDGLYATEKSIYVYGTHYDNSINNTLESSNETSIIHKFSIDDMAISYVNSASLTGRFNWSLSNLRFSEDGDYLRVVTTTGNSRIGFEHKLNVLLDADNEFTVVSQLPNDINTTAIGKVSDDGLVYEDIKAVRFFKDNAYIVTFLTTDPLYVIDLSDNNNPKITGALEIPGYSAYLHPISDNLLLGIGQSVDEGRITLIEPAIAIDEENINTSTIAPVIEGAKVSLFDISDVNAPREIQSIVYENGYTPVEYDYKALSHVITAEGNHRFALPIERWKTTSISEGGNTYMIWQPENFLSLLEVTTGSASAELIHIGDIIANDENSDSGNYSSWDDRSIIHNNDVYYIHGNQVWRSYWLTPEQVTGPF
ncbi:MAG: beta-propeller domain-containing protein [Colwellia sp.]|nr:beta-propeller domain-containing protein [Colwellia sp.]